MSKTFIHLRLPGAAGGFLRWGRVAPALLASRGNVRLAAAVLVFFWAVMPLRAVTLADFGYTNWTVNGAPALGTRPLLLIVASFAGETNSAGAPEPLTQNAAYYDNLVFNQANYPSVNGYFSAASNGRFSWTRAGVVQLSLPESAWDANSPGPPHIRDYAYISNIVYQAMASGQFNFKAFDANGDGNITPNELSILILGNDFTGQRATAGLVTSPDGSYTWGGPNGAAVATVRVTDSPFTVWCEEFEESLGCVDLYGDKDWSWGLTPQSDNPPNYWTLHYLDPWERMKLGWCDPRIVSLAAGGVVTLPAQQAGDPTAPVILYDPAHGTNEFWILEYRTPTSPYGPGYDANVAYAASYSDTNGLAIWHIQQDANYNLITTVSNGATLGRQPADWNEGPPSLKWGGYELWGSDLATPNLVWLNNDPTVANQTPTATHLHVRPFSPGDGSITVEILTAEDVWVDFNYTGSPKNGSFTTPYNTMAAALAAASYGATIHVKSGTSLETPTISKLVTLVGYNGTAAIGH